MSKILLYAPAKINLFLQVMGRRPDGYHDLETWMQKLDLHDTITLELTGGGTGIEFSCDDPELPVGKENLVVKAAKVFFSTLRLESQPKLTIDLQKRIPVAAGLGGGSSDAGTVLKGLNSIYGKPLTDTEMVKIARSLGADVPFFAVEHSAVVAHGIGDVMYPVHSLEGCTIVLVNPGFSVSTRWAFENLSLTSIDKKYKLSCFRKDREDAEVLSMDVMYNDLEKVTSARYPEIAEMKQMLLDLGAVRVLMSGSGPTVFGVFPDAEEIELKGVVVEVSRRFGNKVFLARTNTGAWPSG